MNRWRDKWAVITGASAGIGAAVASELAACGTNLVLTARRQDRLDALAVQLRAQHPIAVEVYAADLARAEAPASLFAFTQAKSIPVALLVNNAGFGAYGEFRDTPLERLTVMTQVNVTAVVALTRLYLPPMIERGGGDILILASTAAFQAVPYMSTYAASKAFDLLFAEGLAEEVRRYGVRVCALCPGTTQTEFAGVAGRRISARAGQSASEVARAGLKALAAGRSSTVSGLGNRLGVVAQRIAPRHWVTRITGSVFRPRGASGH
jgi:short-subunit dehydrogenase